LVFIMADDLGFADVGCYGRTDLRTPNIDNLAGKVCGFFRRMLTPRVRSAKRTALIAGRYQDRLSVGLDEPLAGRDVGLPPMFLPFRRG
jgi:arylsulfatase A-like enzyme